MIDSLLNGLKGQISGDLLSQVGLDASKADDVVKIAGDSAKEVMGKELLSGGLDTVMNLFSKGSNSSSANSLQSSLTNNLVSNFARKLGINETMARTLAAAIVPKVIDYVTKLNSETADTDSSAISGMFGGQDGLTDKAKGMLGGLFS